MEHSVKNERFWLSNLCLRSHYRHCILTHHFVDVLLDQLHSPGLCDHPPSLVRVEPHTLGHIVPEGEGEIVKYSGTSKQDF